MGKVEKAAALAAVVRRYEEARKRFNESADYGDFCEAAGIGKAVFDLTRLPEESRGRWVEEPNGLFRCSECGMHISSIMQRVAYNYCPYCGLPMEEEAACV